MADTEEDHSFYRDHTALYGLQNMKTSFGGYDKKEVKKYLQHILDEQAEEEKSMNKLVDELKMQIASLKRDKDESIQKYNKLLLTKISGSDDGEGLKHESEELQKKVLQLSGQVSTLTSEKEENEKKIAALEQEKKALMDKNAQLGSDSLAASAVSDAKKLFAKQFADLNNEKKELEQQNQKIKGDLAKCENERKQLKDQLDTLQPIFDDTKQQLQEKIKELNTAQQEWDKKASALQKEMDALSNENKRLQGVEVYAENMKQALAKSSEAEAAVRKAKKAVEGKARALELKNTALAHENKQLSESLTQTQEALKETKDYAAKLETELTAAYNELDGDDTNEEAEMPENSTEEVGRSAS
jgi:chromosome segregation ATPase